MPQPFTNYCGRLANVKAVALVILFVAAPTAPALRAEDGFSGTIGKVTFKGSTLQMLQLLQFQPSHMLGCSLKRGQKE